MSLIDQVKALEQDVVARLAELQPAVAEYHELQRVAERLGISTDDAVPTRSGRRASRKTTRGAGSAASTRSSKPRATTSRRRKGAAGGRGNRADQILQQVSRQPGITVAAIGKSLGVDPTGLYRPVRQLVGEGKLRKDGSSLHPAE
jgi:hypothetical protein